MLTMEKNNIQHIVIPVKTGIFYIDIQKQASFFFSLIKKEPKKSSL